jgi:hypothetical protein
VEVRKTVFELTTGCRLLQNDGTPFVDAAWFMRALIVCSFGQYFGQIAPFGLSSSSCTQSCLLSQFEQQR